VKKLKFILLGVFIFINTLSASTELEKVSVQFHWKYQFEFAGFIAAKEKGFYKDVGLDVELKEYEFGIDIQNDVLNGKSTYGVYNSNILVSYLQNKPIKLLSSFFKRSALVIITKPDIKTPKDLIGKTIMATTKKDFDFNFGYMFSQNNIKTDSLKFIPHSFTIDEFINGKCDAMTAFISDQAYQLDKKNIKYNVIDPSNYGMYNLQLELFTSKNESIKNPKRTEAFKNASIKGWEYAFAHPDEIIKIIQNKYNTELSKERLKSEAKLIKRLMLPKMYALGSFDKNFLKKQVEIFKYNHKINENINLDNYLFNIENEQNNLDLTLAEQQYIEDKKTINICIKNNLEPLVIKNGSNYSGISIDYLDFISKSTNLKLNYVYNNSVKDYLGGVKSGKCDIASIITKPNQHEFLIPTTVYGSDTVVIATLINKPFLSDLNDLKDEKVMVQRDAQNMIKYIKYIYPNLNLVEVEDMDLQKVVSGEFYGVIGGSYLLSYDIALNYHNQLKIMTKIGEKIDGSFGISNTQPLLLSIFNKALDQMPLDVKQSIISKYRSIKIEKQIDYKLILQLTVILVLIIIAILFLYYREKRLSKVINDEKDKFKNIFDKASDGISILTDGVFTDCNDSLVELLGYKSKDEVLHLSPSQLSPEYQPDNQKSLDKSLLMMKIAKEYGVNHFEWVHIRANGDKFWADIVLTNISTNDNENVIHVVLRDIQYKKELENELLELNSSLEEKIDNEIEKNKKQQLILMQQSRLAQMGEMISMIAHQWRQPLNTLSLVSQGIYLKYSIGKLDNDSMEKFNTSSKNQIFQMSSTIDDFRNFFKPQKEKNIFNLSKTIYKVLELIAPIYKKEEIELDVDLEESIFINGYSNELGQTLINIINNAKDAILENDAPKLIKLYTRLENDKVLIIIEDSAGGIKQDILEKIFDPYFSTKDEKNGTGLGLYMSKVIVEEHMQGRLNAHNTSDGVRFIIELKVDK